MVQESKTIHTENNSCCEPEYCEDASLNKNASNKDQISYVDNLSVKNTKSEELSNAVHSRYSDIAQALLIENLNKSGYSASCCSPDEIALDKAKSANEENVNIPSLGSDKKLLSYTGLKKGETIIDFGSGPGRDLLSIANSLEDDGKFIGVDFSDKMIEVASLNTQKFGLKNVSFVKSSLDDIKLEDEIADLIISNCVINLLPDKKKAFMEAYRILKSGGRIVFSDYVLNQELDEDNVSVSSYCGCFGNNTTQYYLEALKRVGFKDIETHVEYSVPQQMGTQSVVYYSTIFIGYK